MTVSATVGKAHNIAGLQFGEQRSIAGRIAAQVDVSLAAAKNGTLSTRTSNTVGTLTMAASHGITTGARLDLYWSGGCRRGILVGTVSTNSVPFSGGAGDNLPTQDAVITAMVPTALPFAVVGDNMLALAVYGEGLSQVAITENTPTEQAYYKTLLTAGVHLWYANSGVTNPLAGVTSTQVFVSHGDSTSARTVRVGAIVT